MSSNPNSESVNSRGMPFPILGTVLWTAVLVVMFIAIFLVGLALTWLAAIFIIASILLIMAKRNETQRRINSWTLAIAMEKKIPLKETVGALASESGRTMKGRLLQLYHYIDSGTRFEDAICGVPKVIPQFALPLFRVGCLAGRPRQAMQIICSRQDTENQKIAQTLLGRIFYLTICYAIVTFALSFMAIKIVPEMQKILWDFGYDQTSTAEKLLGFLESPLMATFGVFTACFLMLLFVFCVYALLRLLGTVTFDLPWTGWFMRRFHRSRIQETLSLALECEMPIENALRELAFFYPTRNIRERLGRIYDRVENGEDWRKELRKAGFLSDAEYAVVEKTKPTKELGWMLRMIAERGRRRAIYWVQWLHQILFVGLVLLFGLIVLMMGLTMFLSLSQLIVDLS